MMGDWIMKGLVAICVAGLLFFIVMIADMALATTHPATGQIVNKYYKPAYTTTTNVMVGKVFVPQVQHHSESWNVVIYCEEKDEYYTRTADRDVYENFQIGDMANFEIRSGYLMEY